MTDVVTIDTVSHAVQDYLRVILNLTPGEQRATTKQIAERLDVKPSSVTGMLQKMAQADSPLIDYEKHHGVRLTARGQRAALAVTRHHRLLESFLVHMLGYSWDEVHEEADRLEHVISDELVERIAELLGHPPHDPHGDPIPNRDLQLPEQHELRLTTLRPGNAAIVHRIHDDESALLQYLGEQGLLPQAEIKVLAFDSSDQTLQIQVAGRPDPIVLTYEIGNQILVEQLDNEP